MNILDEYTDVPPELIYAAGFLPARIVGRTDLGAHVEPLSPAISVPLFMPGRALNRGLIFGLEKRLATREEENTELAMEG